MVEVDNLRFAAIEGNGIGQSAFVQVVEGGFNDDVNLDGGLRLSRNTLWRNDKAIGERGTIDGLGVGHERHAAERTTHERQYRPLSVRGGRGIIIMLCLHSHKAVLHGKGVFPDGGGPDDRTVGHGLYFGEAVSGEIIVP